MVDSELPEKGKAKSHTNTNIVSYMYAVNAEDGRPLTYFLYNGSKVDSKAFQKMAAFLEGHSIEVEGVILDRGFCTHDVVRLLEDMHCPYVMMLKGDNDGHKQMLQKYSNEIRWKVKYAVHEKGLFGIAEKQNIFADQPEEAFINLYFDGSNGAQRSVTLISKIMKAARVMQEKADSGEKPTVPDGMTKYLSVSGEGEKYEVIYDYDAWQEALDKKGFCSIASSKDLSPKAIDELFDLI